MDAFGALDFSAALEEASVFFPRVLPTMSGSITGRGSFTFALLSSTYRSRTFAGREDELCDEDEPDFGSLTFPTTLELPDSASASWLRQSAIKAAAQSSEILFLIPFIPVPPFFLKPVQKTSLAKRYVLCYLIIKMEVRQCQCHPM